MLLKQHHHPFPLAHPDLADGQGCMSACNQKQRGKTMSEKLDVKITKKTHTGWVAETEVVLEEIQYNDIGEMVPAKRVLTFSTSKKRVGLISTFASVSLLVKKAGYTTNITEIFGDFCKSYNPVEVKTVTEKSVRAAHEKALEQADTFIEMAKAHYAAKQQKAA
jgi:hypothetical protein